MTVPQTHRMTSFIDLGPVVSQRYNFANIDSARMDGCTDSWMDI